MFHLVCDDACSACDGGLPNQCSECNLGYFPSSPTTCQGDNHFI